MEDRNIKSPILRKLSEELTDVNQNNIDEFWSEVEKNQAPLIEDLESDSKNKLITFLYRGNKEIQNVVMFAGGLTGFDLKKNKFRHLERTDIWYKSYNVRIGTRIEYNFFVNHPSDVEEFFQSKFTYHDSWITDPLNNKSISFVFSEDYGPPKGWEDTKETYSILEVPPISDSFSEDEHIKNLKVNLRVESFSSKVFEDEKKIWVYLLPEYETTNESYKLCVFLDAMFYVTDFHVPQIIENLIITKKIPKTVAIFIGNSLGNREKHFYDREKFPKFLKEEMMPWIRKNFRVSSLAQDNVLVGMSASGFPVVHFAILNPEIFSNVFVQVGDFHHYRRDLDEEEEWLPTHIAKLEKKPLKFVIHGGYYDYPILKRSYRHLRDVLIAKGYEIEYYEYFAGHIYSVPCEHSISQGLIKLLNQR